MALHSSEGCGLGLPAVMVASATPGLRPPPLPARGLRRYTGIRPL